jgi:hypothetical protein
VRWEANRTQVTPRAGIAVVAAAASSIASCTTMPQHPVIYAPAVSSAAALAGTEVDIACGWAGQRVLCTMDSEHTVANPGPEHATAEIELASAELGARAVYVAGVPLEPYTDGDLIRVPLALDPRARTRVVFHAEIALERTGWSLGDEEHPITIWTFQHPLFAVDREAYEYWPVRYCFSAKRSAPPSPALRSLRLPADLEAPVAWAISDAAADDCPSRSGGEPMRVATLELRRKVPLISSGGPVLSVGAVIREGFAAELGYDVAIKRYLGFQPGLRVDTHGEVDLVPLIGLPLALKIGAPVRLQPEHRVGFRFQQDFHFAPDGWPLGLGPVLFLEAWPTDGVRIGLMVSAAF